MAKTTKSQHSAHHWDDVFGKQFKKESDRASVILGAALLDAALEGLLRTFLVPCNTSEDPLFDGTNAPLSTFSARIEMAYRLGIVDATFSRNLHLVRKIRNDFAHNVTGCTFADSAVVSRLTELRRSSGIPEYTKEIRGVFPPGPRGEFQMIVSWLQWMLRARIEHIDPLDQSTAIHGHFSHYRIDETAKKHLPKPDKPDRSAKAD